MSFPYQAVLKKRKKKALYINQPAMLNLLRKENLLFFILAIWCQKFNSESFQLRPLGNCKMLWIAQFKVVRVRGMISQKVTVITEIFVCVKSLYSSIRELSYALNFRTAMTVLHTLVYVHGFHMLKSVVLSALSTIYRYTKLNRVRKFLRLQ